MYKKVFTIDGFDYVYIGYTSGRRWNGWATPHFEFAEALEIMHDYNECAETPMQYDKVYDQFYILDKESDEFEVWKGKDYNTTEGIKHLYGIGAYSWVWDDITDYDIENIAQRIEDFIWEFDTYEHRDQYNDREELVESIIAQLKDFKTLKQAIRIFYNDDLTEELKFEKLGGILRV